MNRILVCDDDDAFAALVVTALEAAGHAVTRCVDVSQLASILGHESFDLLIVDMQMPGGGGPAVARLLASGQAGQPLIVCSGMPADRQKSWFSHMTRARYLQKPVELEKLRATVGELLSQPR